MPRSLLPAVDVRIPVHYAYDPEISPAARDTLMQLFGLAWGLKPDKDGVIELAGISVKEM